MNFNTIIQHNIAEIKQFFIENIINIKEGTKKDKLEIICPFCNDRRDRYKLTINLDWGNFKCFRCGESGSLVKLLKKLGLAKDFYVLLNDLTQLSYFDIKNMIKNDNIEQITTEEEETDNNKKVKKFIKSKGLLSLEQMPMAYDYALSRSFRNKDEIASYLADDRYIYIPIINHDKIISYLGRRYIELPEIPRYIFNTIEEDSAMIGFLDDILDNMTSNSLYITEGYFDAYAINYTFDNSVSICTFGTSKYKTTISKLAQNIPFDTNIFLTMDSIKKDDGIISTNIKFGEELSKYFSNVYVCILENGDPAEIVEKEGTLGLKYQLETNIIPFLKYKLRFSFRNNINQ